MLVYVRRIGTRNIQNRPAGLLKQSGLQAITLYGSVSPRRRERWIEEHGYADESVSQNPSENPDAQEIPVSGDDITHPQEQLCPQLEAPLSDKLPQSLIEWLARINRRYLAFNQEKSNDSL